MTDDLIRLEELAREEAQRYRIPRPLSLRLIDRLRKAEEALRSISICDFESVPNASLRQAAEALVQEARQALVADPPVRGQ